QPLPRAVAPAVRAEAAPVRRAAQGDAGPGAAPDAAAAGHGRAERTHLEDRAPGIPQESLARQVDPAAQTPGPGTGLPVGTGPRGNLTACVTHASRVIDCIGN